MGCCDNKKDLDIHQIVRESYGKIAVTGGSCCGATPFSKQVSQALGYPAEELATLPEGADMGLSCGNPNALAELKPGEVVLDLGSGGGFDVFLAARRVGRDGRVIGVDMTPEMITKARHNNAVFQSQTGLQNVEFRLGEIEYLPVADSSIDVVLSNCVINLSADKAQVWREIGRVLKPGGRLAVSDIAILRTLPDALKQDIEALGGCIAGAVLIDQTRQYIAKAGLVEPTFTAKPNYVKAMKALKEPIAKKVEPLLPEGTDLGDYITSVDIKATKPKTI